MNLNNSIKGRKFHSFPLTTVIPLDTKKVIGLLLTINNSRQFVKCIIE